MAGTELFPDSPPDLEPARRPGPWRVVVAIGVVVVLFLVVRSLLGGSSSKEPQANPTRTSTPVTSTTVVQQPAAGNTDTVPAQPVPTTAVLGAPATGQPSGSTTTAAAGLGTASTQPAPLVTPVPNSSGPTGRGGGGLTGGG
jgi:hypothetical protein